MSWNIAVLNGLNLQWINVNKDDKKVFFKINIRKIKEYSSVTATNLSG